MLQLAPYRNMTREPTPGAAGGRMAGACLLALAVSMLAPATGQAAQDDRSEPVKVQADKKVTRYKEGSSVYTGDVVIDQGSLHATGDRATLYLEDGELVRAVLEGNPATFRERDDEGNLIEGEALNADYRTADREVILTGEAWMTRSGDRISSNRIIYDLADEVIEAGDSEGGSRVDMTLQPRNEPDED
ncbi:MAG: lipopolysaccharide transport periplasmic protein LptA [Guyparkeria sp.]|uniref:lipopolysaccharide transport periplasmic protein LptA n=1 Tax=Guyparkeria sp. TaxID=2035736 RepID=UPI00397BFDDD